METQPDAADARRALDEIDQVRVKAASRRRTPMWIWQLLGLLMFGYLAMLGLPRAWSTWAPVVLFACFIGVSVLYARRSGAALFARNRRARRIGRVVASVDFLTMISAIIAFLRGAGSWVLLVGGAITYALIVIAGPLSERGIDAPTRNVA